MSKRRDPSVATLQAQVEKLTSEVHHHNTELAVVKNDLLWVKEKLALIDLRTWTILGGIIISIIVSVALRVI